jgi:NADPH2:quinone reductase
VFDRGLELLAPLGRMVTYGAIGGILPTVPASRLLGLTSVTGVSITAWRAARPSEARADMTDVAALWAGGRLRSAVHAVFALEEVVRAHEVLESRANMGRVIVRPDHPA